MSETKKVVKVDQSMYEVIDGKVVINSEELANAVMEEKLDLFVDEEAEGWINIGNCGGC